MSRRDFIRGQVNEVSPALALSALNNRWALAEAGDFGSDVDVLNFALTLEYLEAAFYQQGNAANLLSDAAEKGYAAKIQSDEEFHVTAITATIKKLGGTPVQAPGVDFGASFDSRKSFLTTAHTFENVGVGAYLGAAGFIKDKAVLQAAAGIFGVEARHAAVIGNILGLTAEGGVYMGPFEKGVSAKTVLAGVAPFIKQMGQTPTGPVATGGGSTAKDSNTGLLAAGGAALLGAAGVAVYAAKHRAPENAE